MASSDVLWRTSFPERSRPQLYSAQPYNEDGFEVLASSQEFMADISILDGQQMQLLAANNQIALREAQDEFLALEKQFNRIKHKDMINGPIFKDPRKLPDHDVYEEIKEASLYGYKYDPKRGLPPTAMGLPVVNPKDVSEIEKHDVRLGQDPWTQGGFVPGKRQADTIRAKAKDPLNPDAFTPEIKNGRHLVPKMYVDTDADWNERYGRYGAPATKPHTMQPVLLSTRRATAEESVNGTRRGTPILVNKPLRNTRFNGSKVPQTRDVSEAPSIVVSRASTPKRKRGDTPMQSIEVGSPAAKKPKTVSLSTATTNAQGLPRKRHNQYTKARERKEQEAAAAALLAKENGLPSPEKSLPPDAPVLTEKKKPATPAVEEVFVSDNAWRLMSKMEKFEFTHWKPQDLVTAIAEDPSWTAGPFDYYDPNLTAKVQKKLENVRTRVHKAINPIRSWAAYRTWIQWTFDGNDKRGPRKRKSGPNSAAVSSEEPDSEPEAEVEAELEVEPAVAEEETSAPLPASASASLPLPSSQITGVDNEEEDKINNAMSMSMSVSNDNENDKSESSTQNGTISPMPTRRSRGEKVIDYHETDDELVTPRRPRRKTRRS